MGSHSLFQGIFLNPGIKPSSPALQVDSLPSESAGKPHTRKNKSCLETSDNDLKSLLLNMNLKVIEQKAWILASKISDFIAHYLRELGVVNQFEGRYAVSLLVKNPPANA